jgi:hypothetical protein
MVQYLLTEMVRDIINGARIPNPRAYNASLEIPPEPKLWSEMQLTQANMKSIPIKNFN